MEVREPDSQSHNVATFRQHVSAYKVTNVENSDRRRSVVVEHCARVRAVYWQHFRSGAFSLASDTLNVETLAKHIGDLDNLVSLLIRSTRPGRPWASRLLSDLASAQLALQALRLQIIMEKPGGDLVQSCRDIEGTLRQANASTSKSTADGMT